MQTDMPNSHTANVTDPGEPVTDGAQLGERLSAYLEAAAGSLNANTVRAHRADLGRFAAWCAERGLCALPARASTVVAFVEAMEGERAPATVRRYVSTIAAAHKAAGERSPSEHADVQGALRGMRLRRGSRQAQVEGLTWKLRQRLVEAGGGERVIDVRNRAMVAVAYDAMLRRSELVALDVVDVTMDSGGSASLLVRRAKTDPEGGGAVLYLHRDSVRLLGEWLGASEIGSTGRYSDRCGRTGRWAAGSMRAKCPASTGRWPGEPGCRAGSCAASPGTAHGSGAGAGHDRLGRRDGGDHAGRALEEPRHGAALRRAPACEAQRRRAARAAPETPVSPGPEGPRI